MLPAAKRRRAVLGPEALDLPPGAHYFKKPEVSDVSTERVQPEFSRLVRADEVGDEDLVYEFEATADERRALAQRFSLLSLDRLTAVARVRRGGSGGGLRVRVNFAADVVQSCVVTLDPVPAHIEESLELAFVPEAEMPTESDVVVLDPEAEDPPEAIRDGVIDLGEAVAEHLALALDPYPRKPGASVSELLAQVAGEDDEEDRGSPFAALQRLKRGS